MFNSTEILFLILMSILFICLIISIALLLYMIRIKRRIDESSRVLFHLLRHNKIYNDRVYDMSNNVELVLENIKTLSKSFNEYLIKEEVKNNKYVMPTPEVARNIQETIKEQIATEIAMIKDVRIIDNSIIHRIAYNVIRSYPDIDREYIVRKCLAIINSIDSDQE